MKYCFKVLWVFCLLINAAAQAQDILSTKSKKAKEYYLASDNFRVRGQLDQAIDLLKKAIDKDEKFEEAYFRLALTYRSANNLQAASEMLEKGLRLTTFPAKVKTYHFTLSECYLRQGKYDLALKSANQFINDEKFDKAKLAQMKVWKGQCEFALANQGQSLAYQLKPLSDTVNAFPLQYFPTITADEKELIFTMRMGIDHNANEDIMVSTRDKNNRWTKPVSISQQINSDFREGASTISADGRTLIFTICGPRGCDLYESNKVGDEWSEPNSLGSAVNSSGWEAQPSLSSDGNELYFVSERKGGLGGYDIWYSRKGDNGNWTKAVNVGAPINTPFNEIAPYIHVNNQNLYFASNGLPGFGSYDIYVAEKKGDTWQAPENMGAPLNDFEDQYSFTVTSNGKVAYYSKEEGRDHSKIFTTPIPERFQISRKGNVVSGRVTDAVTKKPLKAKIELKELSSNITITHVLSDSITGSYLIVVPGKSEYALFVNEPGYLFQSRNFNYSDIDLTQAIRVDLELFPAGQNSAIVLENIFFETNQFELLNKSSSELDHLVAYLLENPAINIEISGHTDNEGTDSYNQQLSMKRAHSVGTYLKNRGIHPDRVVERGYGSKKPLYPNDSEANRQKNRRIQLKIMK